MKLLAGKLAPFSGQVTRADKLSVGYFAQHQVDELDLDGSPYDHVRRLMPDAPETKVRGRTGAIGFSGKAGDTLVKSLSGGEKARLLLGLATFFGPNMIILDEPTNHLDIDSRAALAEAINDFPGAVIMVSHDRYLIEACADQLWVVADQAVTATTATSTITGAWCCRRAACAPARATRGEQRARPRQARSAARAEKRAPPKQRISDAEAEIERINGIIAKIDTALALPDLFKRDPKQAAQLGKARAGAAARCSGPRKNGWRRVRNMTRPPAEALHLALSPVIASEAKQSIAAKERSADCFPSLAMTEQIRSPPVSFWPWILPASALPPPAARARSNSGVLR